MKSLLLIMTFVAIASAKTCRNDRDVVNCATELTACATAVTAADVDAVADELKKTTASTAIGNFLIINSTIFSSTMYFNTRSSW